MIAVSLVRVSWNAITITLPASDSCSLPIKLADTWRSFSFFQGTSFWIRSPLTIGANCPDSGVLRKRPRAGSRREDSRYLSWASRHPAPHRTRFIHSVPAAICPPPPGLVFCKFTDIECDGWSHSLNLQNMELIGMQTSLHDCEGVSRLG